MAEPRAIDGNPFGALRRLRALRTFEKRHLPFVKTLEDRDLLCEIGHRQCEGKPLTLKEIFLLDLASVPTLQRRLRRLRHCGAIQLARRAHDRRAYEVTLSPKVLKVFARYGQLMADLPAEQ